MRILVCHSSVIYEEWHTRLLHNMAEPKLAIRNKANLYLIGYSR